VHDRGAEAVDRRQAVAQAIDGGGVVEWQVHGRLTAGRGGTEGTGGPTAATA
jgi:hypothetical protein